eukprot:UN11162
MLKKQNKELKKENIDLIQTVRDCRKKYDVIKIENEHLHHSYRVNVLKVNELNCKCNALKQENDDRLKELRSIKEVLVTKKKLQINVSNLDVLDLEALTVLEKNLLNGLIEVQENKERLIENKYLCIICCKHERNISFSSCNHVVLCTQCERKVESKKCPICQQPYFSVDTLQF